MSRRVSAAALVALAALSSAPVIAADPQPARTDSLVRDFVKGDIAGKTAAVRSSTGGDAERLAALGLDFSAQNAQLLAGDRDLSALAVASVLAVPRGRIPLFADKLVTAFALFPDDNVRSAVLERLASAADDQSVRQRTLALVGVCFDEDLFFGAKCLSVIKNSEGAKKFADFSAELAENALLHVTEYMDGAGGSPDPRAADLQLSALSVLASARWTRAAALVSRSFSLSAGELSAGVIDEERFAEVVRLTAEISSSETARAISDCLASFNGAKERGEAVPSGRVLLAVINSLGALGDKSAFDNLLYATYLGYPEEVVAAAREALSKLRW